MHSPVATIRPVCGGGVIAITTIMIITANHGASDKNRHLLTHSPTSYLSRVPTSVGPAYTPNAVRELTRVPAFPLTGRTVFPCATPSVAPPS